MAQEVGSLYYDLTIDDKKFKSGLAGADSHMKEFGQKLHSTSQRVTQGLAIAAAGAVAFGVASVKAFTEAQDVMAQTNAVIKSTGGAAGISAQQVSELATSLQGVTKFSDETIQTGQNLLLTFTKIGADIFPQATEVMLDMSQALGQDVKSSAIQLGKALQDPILGVTALRRVGVNFNEAQQEVIKNLVETGRAGEAQAMILKELQTEFGGSAKAAGETFAGRLTILKNRLGDVQEAIGAMIVNSLGPLITKISDFLARVDWGATLERARVAVVNLWTTVSNFLEPFINWIVEHREGLLQFFSRFGIAIIGVSLAVTALTTAWGLMTNPVVIIAAILAGMYMLWENHRLVFWGLVAVLGPLAIAFGILRGAMLLQSIVTGLTTAFSTMGAVMTGQTVPAMARLGAQGAIMRGALLAIPTAIAISVAMIGFAVVMDQINKVNQAFDNAARSAKEADASLQRYLSKFPAGPERSRAFLELQKHQGVGAQGRQFGGPVTRGMPYIVGEVGPELFLPPRSGEILSNDMLRKFMRGFGQGGDTYVSIGNIEDREDADYILRRLDRNQTLESMGGSPA